ncbi:amidohydrolase [Pelagibius sp. Alg239-R121]|uniref:amidohydrolase n=1 Tax=Pelagibius sp. Alg239-R121 TaxID=2993448 RepID=UPI0024A6A3E9|nr:amidohydrolase [Pelagibius sp. Alg239-R121]
MSTARILSAAALLLTSTLTSGPVVAGDAMVLTNARIYTVDAERSRAEAMAIDESGVILAVGSNEEIVGTYGTGIDLKDRMVLPGFQDAHLHAVEAGITANFCLLPQFGSKADYEQALTDCADELSDRSWVIGAGVNMAALLDSLEDPLGLIDSIIEDRPAVILDDLGHGAWANTQALAAAGFDSLTQDPRGGILVRMEDGSLTGVVLESASQTLMDVSQPPTPENLDFALKSLSGAMEILAANGITSVSDAGGYWPRGHETVWERAEAEEILTVRASNALYLYPNFPLDRQIKELKKRYSNDPARLVRFNQVKIYLDGILSQATGLLYAPYEASLGLAPEENRGFAYFTHEDLFRYATELSAAGFQLHFHATGDRGTGLALDTIEQADATSGPHRITHLYMIAPKDRPRFRDLGVVADFQLAPSSVGSSYRESIAEFIGGRAGDLMPLRALHDAGALITLSSDWDADELSPLVKLQTVLTRDREGAPNLAAAIEMMTINPARLLRHADRTGSIEPGKFADLVILDRDLFEVSPAEMSEVQIEATLLQGEAVFDPTGLLE